MPAPASADARGVLDAHRAIDLHADTLMWARWLGYDLLRRHTPPLPRAALGGHVDLPRMTSGGAGGQFFGLVSLPLPGTSSGLSRAVHEQIDALDATVARSEGKLRKVRTTAEIAACHAAGAVSALLGIEGAHALEGDLERLEAFAGRGVRYLGLAHFSANEACFPAYGRGRRDSEGLTRFGRALIERCESLGVLVDLAHVNRRGFMDACGAVRTTPIVSHTGASGAFPHWRNIDDDQLRAVADRGGVVGVMFCPRFLGADGLGPVVRHLRHVLDVAGEDTPALGSDWDGFIVPTAPLSDPTGLPSLVDALLQAGLTEGTIGKILRANVLRVLASP
jgi:membrane dipeptidase